ESSKRRSEKEEDGARRTLCMSELLPHEEVYPLHCSNIHKVLVLRTPAGVHDGSAKNKTVTHQAQPFSISQPLENLIPKTSYYRSRSVYIRIHPLQDPKEAHILRTY